MTSPKLSKRKADAISNGVFLISLGILFYTSSWWPGILLAIWAMLATREFLTGRLYDLFITSTIFLGLYCVYFLNIQWAILMPIIFVIGGIYIIFREYYYSDPTELKRNIDIEREIEESKHDK
ncbi:MAG: hypothetical protein VX777_04745 [Chlamydiota bacterium]|nr:hypothetical protein [Chlamydiota bacterium]